MDKKEVFAIVEASPARFGKITVYAANGDVLRESIGSASAAVYYLSLDDDEFEYTKVVVCGPSVYTSRIVENLKKRYPEAEIITKEN